MSAALPATRNWVGVPTPALYDVQIGHGRPRPVRRNFTHRAFPWLVDLDDIAAARLAQGPVRAVADGRRRERQRDGVCWPRRRLQRPGRGEGVTSQWIVSLGCGHAT